MFDDALSTNFKLHKPAIYILFYMFHKFEVTYFVNEKEAI